MVSYQLNISLMQIKASTASAMHDAGRISSVGQAASLAAYCTTNNRYWCKCCGLYGKVIGVLKAQESVCVIFQVTPNE